MAAGIQGLEQVADGERTTGRSEDQDEAIAQLASDGLLVSGRHRPSVAIG